MQSATKFALNFGVERGVGAFSSSLWLLAHACRLQPAQTGTEMPYWSLSVLVGRKPVTFVLLPVTESSCWTRATETFNAEAGTQGPEATGISERCQSACQSQPRSMEELLVCRGVKGL